MMITLLGELGTLVPPCVMTIVCPAIETFAVRDVFCPFAVSE